jgi:hypothetical protein
MRIVLGLTLAGFVGLCGCFGPAVAQSSPAIGGCAVFPTTSIFNTPINDGTRFPAHPRSAAWIDSVGRATKFHPDWGLSEDQKAYDGYYGIPYNVIGKDLADWPVVAHSIVDTRDANGAGVPQESDCAAPKPGGRHELVRDCTTLPAASRRFPFPPDATLKAEKGACNDPKKCGDDRHVLVLEQGACRLWESYFTYKIGRQWKAFSTAAWDLTSHEMRPAGWTSADAAGLPILPLLVRVDEATAGEINHALRVTFQGSKISDTYVWPASHKTDSTGQIPMGSLLRLKAGFVIPAEWTTQAKAIAKAMQTYGLYVADNGSNLFVQGEPSIRWQSSTFSQLKSLTLTEFEFVDLSAITSDQRFSPTSYQARW